MCARLFRDNVSLIIMHAPPSRSLGYLLKSAILMIPNLFPCFRFFCSCCSGTRAHATTMNTLSKLRSTKLCGKNGVYCAHRAMASLWRLILFDFIIYSCSSCNRFITLFCHGNAASLFIIFIQKYFSISNGQLKTPDCLLLLYIVTKLAFSSFGKYYRKAVSHKSTDMTNGRMATDKNKNDDVDFAITKNTHEKIRVDGEWLAAAINFSLWLLLNKHIFLVDTN